MEKVNKFFKTGIVHFMAFPETMDGVNIEQTIKKIACDEHFEVIEITFINDPEKIKIVKGLLDSSGLDVYFGAQPVLLRNNLNVNAKDENHREKSIKVLEQCIDQAYEIGAKGLSFLSGRYEEATKSRVLELLIDSTERVCQYAKDKGSMMIELEVFDYDVDKKSLIGPASMAKDFAERIRKKYDNFGLLIDLSHLPLVRESPAQAVVPLKDFITHIHIGNCLISDKNSPLYGDYHPPFGFPGTEIGLKEITEFLQVFIDIDFFNSEKRVPLSFEVKPVQGQDPDVIIANSKRMLNQALQLLKY